MAYEGSLVVVPRGGTGIGSYTTGDLLYASNSSTLSKLAIGSSSQVLHGGTTPSWSSVSLTSDVSGTLPSSNGGTGVNNGSSTLTLGGSLTTSGAFPVTFNFTASTNVTFPTSGTLATTSGVVSDIIGTANQVLANGTSGSSQTGSVTLTLPQSISTTSNVQFGSIGINTAPTVSFDNAGLSSARNSYFHGSVLGSLGLAYGIDISLAITGTVTSGSILRIFPNLQTNITTFKGIEIANGSSSGTVTNAYHAFVEAPTYGTTNAAIYAANFTTYTTLTPPTNGIAIQGNSIFKGTAIASGLNTSAPLTAYAGTNTGSDGISLQLATTSGAPISLQFFNHSTATAGNQGYCLQSLAAGGANKPLYLSPNGGGVSIGQVSAPGNGNLSVQNSVYIGLSSGLNTLDVYGQVAIGQGYAASFSAPTNGLIVQGFFGIGTPIAPHEITLDGTNPIISVQTGSVEKGQIQATASAFNIISQGTNALILNNVGAGSIQFLTNNIERMRINSSGQVGVGNLPASYAIFTAYGATTNAHVVRVSGSLAADDTAEQVGMFLDPIFASTNNNISGYGIFSTPLFNPVSTNTIPFAIAVYGKVQGTIGSGTVNFAASGYFDTPTLGTVKTALYATNALFNTIVMPTGTSSNPCTITSYVANTRNVNIALTGNSIDGSSDSTNGIAIMLVHNASGNRHIGFGDTANMASGSASPSNIIRMIPINMSIDGIATDGATILPITFGNASAVTTILGSGLTFGTSGSTRMTINSSGNVLIGTTTDLTNVRMRVVGGGISISPSQVYGLRDDGAGAPYDGGYWIGYLNAGLASYINVNNDASTKRYVSFTSSSDNTITGTLTEMMRVYPLSGVTIGSGSGPTYKLDVFNGHIGIMTAGNTLRVKQGTNACCGTGAVMVAGAVTVNTTAVATGDLVITTRTASAGTLGLGEPTVTIVNGTSFTLTSSSALDTSTYSWIIFKAA